MERLLEGESKMKRSWMRTQSLRAMSAFEYSDGQKATPRSSSIGPRYAGMVYRLV